MIKAGQFSKCRKYRFQLTRVWNEKKDSILFIGLNPSLANETQDDKTIRKCIQYAKDWDFGALVMVNLFPYITPYPYELSNKFHLKLKENDLYLRKEISKHSQVVLMWGNIPKPCNRDLDFLSLLKNPLCFRQNKNGMPTHPLYLPKDLKLKKFTLD